MSNVEKVFRPGDPIPHDGNFQVIHEPPHEPPHQVYFKANGLNFPPCRNCEGVTFSVPSEGS